jgi:hypothetical protein
MALGRWCNRSLPRLSLLTASPSSKLSGTTNESVSQGSLNATSVTGETLENNRLPAIAPISTEQIRGEIHRAPVQGEANEAQTQPKEHHVSQA